MKNRVLFYSSVKSKKLFSTQSFYSTDIKILRDLGNKVILSNKICQFFMFWKYDISFIYFYRFGLFAGLISKFFSKKVYFTGGIDDLEESYSGRKKYLIQKYFFKMCSKVSDKNIIVSTSDYNHVLDLDSNKRFKEKLYLSHHVIDVDLYRYSFAIQKEKIITTIGWMGVKENVLRKGIDKSVLIFKKIASLHPEYKLIIIGEKGKGSEYIDELVQQNKLENNVFLTGNISEVSKVELLKKSKFYFQFSAYEGFGIAAIEALCAGNVVFHSGRGGLSDSVGSNGFKFEEINNYDLIADQVNNLIENYTEIDYSNLINTGINYVYNKFTYNERKMDLNRIINNSSI